MNFIKNKFLLTVVSILTLFFVGSVLPAEIQKDKDEVEVLPKEITNSIGMNLRLIPTGSFQMGSNKGDIDEKPVHAVTISKPYYIGSHEVTQDEYVQVMGSNPSKFKESHHNPVENVSWNDAVEFCRRLSQEEGVTYRLPTEAEWEYACRAGTTTTYYWGDSSSESIVNEYAWYDKNADSRTHPVGLKKPNDWGLYDMSGNVWEWCSDRYGFYSSTIKKDEQSSFRVLRGGSRSGYVTGDIRSTSRRGGHPDSGGTNFGFRIVLELKTQNEKVVKYMPNLKTQINLVLWKKLEVHNKALKSDPENADTYFELGNLYATLKKYEISNKYCLEYLEKVDSTDANRKKVNQTLFEIGLNYYNLKQYSKSATYFLKLVEYPRLEIEFSDLQKYAIYYIGLNFNFLEQHKKAIDYFSRFLIHCTDSPQHSQLIPLANHLLGNIHMTLLQKDVDKIKQDNQKDKSKRVAELAKKNAIIAVYLNKSIELNPNLEPSYMHLGNYYYYCQDIDRAVSTYEKLIEKFPNSADLASYKNFLEKMKLQAEKKK